MMFAELPVEILHQIGFFLPDPDLGSLLPTSRRLKEIFTRLLYRNLELRVLYLSPLADSEKNKTWLYPKSLLKATSKDYYKDTQSLSLLDLYRPRARVSSDYDDCIVIDPISGNIILPILDLISRIPQGKLQMFEYKSDYRINTQLFARVIDSHSSLTSLSLVLLGELSITDDEMSRIALPNLKRLHIRWIKDPRCYNLIYHLLRGAVRVTEMNFHSSCYGGAFFGITDRIYPEIVRHRPKVLKLSRFIVSEELLDALEDLQEFHLRDFEVTEELSLGQRALSIKRLLISLTPKCMTFLLDEFLEKIKTGLEELHIILDKSLADPGSLIRESIPVPKNYVLKHKATLRHLSLFETAPGGEIKVDSHESCSDELALFEELKLDEYATALKFRCQQRDSTYWETFDMTSIDADYSHFASLKKLYVMPDIKSLFTQIKSERSWFWELNPRNSFTYQMASIVLTNIAYYAEKMPRIEYIIVGKGDFRCGQKVFEVTWRKQVPWHRPGNIFAQPNFVFTLSTAYELSEMRAEGVKFHCFEGTRFSEDEDTQCRTFLTYV